MNFPSDYRYRIRCAVSEDAARIAQIFNAQNYEGGIAVSFLRNPDPLLSFLREGDELIMIVLEDREEKGIIGMGGCVISAGYLNGRICRVGYLTGLKLLPEYHGKIRFIPHIYEEMHRLTKDKVEGYYTTILSDNKAVQKMLEKHRRSMPAYCFLGEYHTYFCKTGKGVIGRIPEGYEVKLLPAEEVSLFYQEACAKGSFAPAAALQNDRINGEYYGLYLNGALQAAGYVLDQRDYKQYSVHHYSGIYRVLSRLPVGILGYPNFPKAGVTANCAAAGIWCGRHVTDTARSAKLLFQEIREKASRFDFLIIGVYDGDPVMEAFRGQKKIDYRSRVYQVCFSGDTPVEEKDRVQLEVGFL